TSTVNVRVMRLAPEPSSKASSSTVTVMTTCPPTLVGVNVRVPVADGLVYSTTGSGMIDGLLEVARTVNNCTSLDAPVLMPVRLTSCAPAPAATDRLAKGSRLGGSFTGRTLATNAVEVRFPAASSTVTVIVAEPDTSCNG